MKSEKNGMIFNGPMNIIQKLEDLGVMASGHFAQKDTELSWGLTHAGELMIAGTGEAYRHHPGLSKIKEMIDDVR